MIVTVRLGPDERHDRDAREQERDRQHHVDEQRDHGVDPAAEVARDHADDHAEHHRDQRRDHADEQRDPAAVGDADEEVAAQVVGAEEERAAGALRQALRGEADVAVLVVGPVADERGHQRGAERDQRDEHDDDRARPSRRGRGAAVPRPAARGCGPGSAPRPRARWRPGRRDRGRACRGRLMLLLTASSPPPPRPGRTTGRARRRRSRASTRVSSSPSASGKWQATWCSGGSSARGTSSGSSVRQRSCAFGQRGWNRQPDGGAAGEGRSPRRTIRSRPASASGSAVGTADEQRAGVGVAGVLVQVLGVRDLDDLAEVHHRDPVADVAHHRQVVRDEHVGQLQLAPAARRAG